MNKKLFILLMFLLILVSPIYAKGTIAVDGNFWVWNRFMVNNYLFPETYGDVNQCLASSSDGNLFWMDVNTSGGGGDTYWTVGTALGSIKYEIPLADVYVGINKDPSISFTLDVGGKIGASDDITTTAQITANKGKISELALGNINPISGVKLAIRPAVSGGSDMFRLYDYLGTNYGEIRYLRDGSNNQMVFRVKGTELLRLDRDNYFVSTNYDLKGNELYSAKALDMGHSIFSCRRNSLNINLSTYVNYITTDGENCNVTINDPDNLPKKVYKIKNMDPTYTLKMYSSDNQIDYQYDVNNTYELLPYESITLQSMKLPNETHYTWAIIGDSG